MISSRAASQAAMRAAARTAIAPRAARTYAQAAPATGGASKPPVPLYGVDGTYASALYTAAAKVSSLDSTARALDNMSAVFKKDPKLSAVLAAPTLTPDDKRQIVTELQKHIGTADKGDVVKNFLGTLAENNRLGVLEAVCEKFGTLMGAYRGEVEMVVTSATPLENRVLRQLETAVSKSKYVGQGQKLKVVPKVNADIRGGLVVEIADRTIDVSVAAKMAKMNKLLTDTL